MNPISDSPPLAEPPTKDGVMAANDIKPVRLSELPALLDEFFGLAYRVNRLGIGGIWDGSGFASMGLNRAVDRETFVNVFSFRSPAGDHGPSQQWREQDPIIAQCITYTGNPLVSKLWGLGNPEQCKALIEARTNATTQAMKLLRLVSSFESESTFPILGRGCLHANFLSGAAEDQTPRLESTILIANQYRLPNGSEVHFPLNLAPGAASELINRWEWRRLSDSLGTFGLTERTQVPDNLFTPPTLKDLGPLETTLLGNVADRRLAGAELFKAWHNQAASNGFGPEKVQAIFEAGKLIGGITRWERNNFSPDGIKSAYHALARTGSRISMAPDDKDHGHGPSFS